MHSLHTAMINWWPVTASRLEDPRYRSLTTTERLYLEYIISEYSLRGPFCRSDLEIAVTLGLSEDKVRRARRRVGRATDYILKVASEVHCRPLATGFGWVVYMPGWRSGTQNLATKYVDVPMATVPKGDFFASVPRYTFEVLLALVRGKKLIHADVVVWLVLSYMYWRCRGKREDHCFFITKRELSQLSGVPNASACVEHLHKQYCFKGGDHLFEYMDQGPRLVVSEWTWCTDPRKDKTSTECLKAFHDEIAKAVELQKQRKDMSRKKRKPQRSYLT